MSERIAAAFARARAENRAALITFVTAGDPSVEAMPAILAALADAGADIIELGMPFTDPMADGPSIQAANIRSLAGGTATADVFGIASDFFWSHSQEVPIVLMGYANPMLRHGAGSFADSAGKAEVAGVICVDIPPEEDEALGPALREAGVAPIRLATPTTDAARLPAILDGAEGFLYYVSVAGITGLQQAAAGTIEAAVARLKAATDLPVAVGFGIRTPEQAAAVARVADGVVVGSAIVDLVAAHGADAPAAIASYVGELSAAIRQARKVPA
jgi:tryptophan synthase alpha chain